MYELRVTDGAATCELAAAPNVVLEYVPGSGAAHAGERQPWAGPLGTAGATSEELRLALGGESLEGALAGRAVLARLLRQAERVQAGSGEPCVYVESRRTPTAAPYRSELLGGELAEVDGEGYWPGSATLRLVVRWLRRPWWEGAETEIALLGPAGEEQLGGMEVLCAAGPRGGAGYVDCAAIGGELPAPVKLRFTNEAADYPVARLCAALRSETGPAGEGAALSHVLEAEAARAGGTTLPPAVDEQYSGGRYRALSWSDAAETRLIDWDLPQEQLAAAGGRRYRLLARLCPAPAYTDLRLQARVTIDGAVTLWSGPWAASNPAHEGCELGSLAVPPFAAGSSVMTGLRSLRLELWGKRAAAGLHSFNLDYLALFGLDGYRRYEALPAGGPAPGLDAGCYLIDDEPAGELYAHLADGNVNYWLAAGESPALRPGCRHRLCLFWENTSGQARGDRPARVQLWYRPRVAIP